MRFWNPNPGWSTLVPHGGRLRWNFNEIFFIWKLRWGLPEGTKTSLTCSATSAQLKQVWQTDRLMEFRSNTPHFAIALRSKKAGKWSTPPQWKTVWVQLCHGVTTVLCNVALRRYKGVFWATSEWQRTTVFNLSFAPCIIRLPRSVAHSYLSTSSHGLHTAHDNWGLGMQQSHTSACVKCSSTGTRE